MIDQKLLLKKIFIFIIIVSFISCTADKKNDHKLFSPDVLQQQLFLIDPSKDTTLNTLHGSMIHISAGSFTSSSPVRVEIKEAFTSVEMLAARLTTESNGELLSSGGMIYVNATANGRSADLTKPIKISIPYPQYDTAMKVFKGIQTDSSTINWTDPQPTDTTPKTSKWFAGENLFERNCASCHTIFKELAGPQLAGIDDRVPDRRVIHQFLINPPLTISTYPYFLCLKEKYGSMHPSFLLSAAEIDTIIDYINNEAAKFTYQTQAAPEVDTVNKFKNDASRCNWNDCGNDTVYIPQEKTNQSFFADDPVMLAPSPDTISQNKLRKPEELEDLRNGFTDPNPTNGMYDFEIKTFGWYNIDAFVGGYIGTQYVTLQAQVQIDFDIDLHVYLFIPSRKMLSVGYDRKGDKFLFDKVKGAIPLFINDEAMLLAFGSSGEKMYYGITSFKVQAEQTIQIKIKETTEENLKKTILSKQLEGIDLGLEKKQMKVIKKPCNQDVRNK